MSRATVIIPTYNRPEAIKQTLDSIEEMESSIEYSVMIVDDSDEDRTKKICEDHAVDLEYVRPEISENLPHARNVGIGKADGEIVAFVDDDVRFYDGWVDEVVEAFENNEEAGAVGGPALEFEDGEPKKTILNSTENQNVVTEKGFITDKSTRWVPEDTVETDTLRGANMAFQKSVLEQVGGFDEEYIGNSFREDTDICVRLKRRGYRIIYNPEAKIEHLYLNEGGTRDKSKHFWYSLGYNQRKFVEKNFPSYRLTHFINLAFFWSYEPYSLLKIILSSLKDKKLGRLAYIKGFIEGE